jgi:hypothetical protein
MVAERCWPGPGPARARPVWRRVGPGMSLDGLVQSNLNLILEHLAGRAAPNFELEMSLASCTTEPHWQAARVTGSHGDSLQALPS